jgi:delta-1-pyrroline-5-carboxylate synthetase
MGRGGIGGSAGMTMENADSARAFVKDVKRIIIKVVALSVSFVL